ncbi:hypothetical protein Y032_0009g719 [Ancylostoma ceylanicum]|uniref:Apple domain-containing protein n=1 Tax=Ancylostoma ceylanicum TaxID=53326 RepID=A0A016VJ22_9BILA|nr:hypothetical protein Y032_0009g719 [Ancylostoma ceylanicum]
MPAHSEEIEYLLVEGSEPLISNGSSNSSALHHDQGLTVQAQPSTESKMHTLQAAVLLAFLAPVLGQCSLSILEFEFYGRQKDSIPVGSLEECVRWCYDDSSCDAMTFDPLYFCTKYALSPSSSLSRVEVRPFEVQAYKVERRAAPSCNKMGTVTI